MLTVVCWKWQQPGGRAKFSSEHVNVLRNMVERNYRNEHQVVCFTDDDRGIDRRVRCFPVSNSHGNLQNPLGPEYPSCYRRLVAFSPGFEQYVGERFISLDLDCVIVDDVTTLWDRPEDIVFWQSPIRAPDYNGSMWMVRTGSREELYTEFDPKTVPELTHKANKIGSDQGWFSYRCPGEAVWTQDDGVWSWKPQLRNRRWILPPGARIVFFPGAEQPWDESTQDRAAWIRQHYK
jgi:hypothetical protein